jgi:bacterioferritin-associated ferredoxin
MICVYNCFPVCFAQRWQEESSMYVCVCNAITDREIRGAAELGVRTLEDLSATLGVATCCRKCSDCARKCLAEAVADSPACAGAG